MDKFGSTADKISNIIERKLMALFQILIGYMSKSREDSKGQMTPFYSAVIDSLLFLSKMRILRFFERAVINEQDIGQLISEAGLRLVYESVIDSRLASLAGDTGVQSFFLVPLEKNYCDLSLFLLGSLHSFAADTDDFGQMLNILHTLRDVDLTEEAHNLYFINQLAAPTEEEQSLKKRALTDHFQIGTAGIVDRCKQSIPSISKKSMRS